MGFGRLSLMGSTKTKSRATASGERLAGCSARSEFSPSVRGVITLLIARWRLGVDPPQPPTSL